MRKALRTSWRRAVASSLIASTFLLTLGISQITTASAQEAFRTKQEQLNWEKTHETASPSQSTADAPSTTQQPDSPAATFNANAATLGAIPDSLAGPQAPGDPLNVTFTVSGLTGNVQTIAVNMTFNPAHTFAGDIVATLIAPNGTTLDIFGYTGATTATSFGDSSDLAGPYTFSDTATGDWWAAATAAGSAVPIPAGSYRTSVRGGSASGGTQTSLNAIFAGLTPAQANGTWTLRFTDGGAGDTGSVSAASLDITTATVAVVAKPCFDFFGSGRTSFATARAAPSGGNIVWDLRNNGGTGTQTVYFGVAATDNLTPGYYDNDSIADIGVWRSGTPATFFIRPSTALTTLQGTQFGQTGDIPGRQADYDGDGRDDYTVLRNVGGSWVWYYLGSNGNTFKAVTFGLSTDAPLAGADYNGDGRADLTVIRTVGSQSTYLVGDSVSGTLILSQQWGNFNTDFYVIGDYLGDTKADFAVWRGATGGNGQWYIKENGGPGQLGYQWGIATTDKALCGDYNGDGKSDVAVYRPSNSTFYWINSGATATVGIQQSGFINDLPIPSLKTF